ncbi:hypothetical protein ACLMJK_003759 [Lecanora helva]
MPLDASASADTYSAPTSSPDPYASSTDFSDLPPSTRIDLSTLPSGLPILGPLTGYTPARLGRTIQARCQNMSHTLSRPLSPEEFSTLAYHTAKGHAIASWGPSLGLAAGMWRFRKTRQEFRWPFYGALKVDAEDAEAIAKGVTWDGERLRVSGRELLQAVSATTKARWLHIGRGTIYGVIGLVFVPAAVSAYAATTTTVGELRDPRLKDLTRDLRLVTERKWKEEKEKRGEMREERTGQTTGQGRKDAGAVYRERSERLRGRKQEEVDDMSPTGGGIGFGDDDDQSMMGMGGVLSDGQMSQREAQAQFEAGESHTGNRTRPSRGTPRRFTGTKDDPRVPIDPSDIEKFGGGSVWERIRQESSSGSTPSSTGRGNTVRGEQQEGSTLGDSFSFSSSEEERSYAKEEAQKEFDERVERERKGEDFSGSGRRW